jgi:hypothetical protein
MMMMPYNYVIEIFQSVLFAIFSFSISDNGSMIPSGFQIVVYDPYAIFYLLCIAECNFEQTENLQDNKREIILNLS